MPLVGRCGETLERFKRKSQSLRFSESRGRGSPDGSVVNKNVLLLDVGFVQFGNYNIIKLDSSV